MNAFRLTKNFPWAEVPLNQAHQTWEKTLINGGREPQEGQLQTVSYSY